MLLAILQAGPGEDGELLHFDPYLTGKHLLTSQTFKSLFRSEVVGGAQGLAIRDIALLFTDIRGSTALYQRIGDLNAYQLVQQHFDLLRETTVRHGGAIVKTIGDAVMAAYPDASRAVAAALDMRGAIERFNEGQPERPVLLKIGIHHGAAIAVTLNDELDYFGQTVNIASRVQEMADAAEIWITEDVWRYPGVRCAARALSRRAAHGRVPGHRATHDRAERRQPERSRGRAEVLADGGRADTGCGARGSKTYVLGRAIGLAGRRGVHAETPTISERVNPMKLYLAPGACSLADHIALHEADLEFDRVRVDLRTKRTEDGGDFNEVNPKGYVPALVLDDGQLLTENVAILAWVAERAPKLAPGGELGRIRLIEMLAFIATELHKPFVRSFFPDQQ